MALSGLDIYKLLPKTNCKDCGFATCLAFAMALAQKRVSLDKCPHVSALAKEALEAASRPPVGLVTIGAGDDRIETGNELVMFRHEQKFFHPTAVGVLVDDTLDEEEVAAEVADINALHFERAGQRLGVELICVGNSSRYKNRFVNTVRKVEASTSLNMALMTRDAAALTEAVKICGARRPLLICEDVSTFGPFVSIAALNKLPIAVMAGDIEEAALLTEKAREAGVVDVIIGFKGKGISSRIQDFTLARRTALKKNAGALGCPFIAFTESTDPEQELMEAVSYLCKYAGILIIKNTDREYVFPLLVARQDIYQDPQKPVQVEPGIYEIGRVAPDSPVLVTTNFSITYFTVASEVESSKVPCRIVCCDAEGMSVLTAWAAEKFTAEKITDTLMKSGIENMVSRKKIVIPGYVSVLSGRLEELSGWKVTVGPREASGIPAFMRNLK